ncbi:MAG: hypothetical protein IT440_12320 [Phycisphaeraceae bacterium]|nr:hypothetical protein [Phycisphaeraceae bacterium]
MTPRQRVELALQGRLGDRVPFTIYEGKIPQCVAERQMRNRGLCIVNRLHPVYRAHSPNVQVRGETYTDAAGRHMTRTWYDTPVGVVSSLSEPAGFTTWQHERLFKSPDDYKVLRFLLQDEQYEPTYDSFLRAQQALGDDFILRAGLGLEPLQSLISGNLIGMEQFAIEWMDNRDEILTLVDIIVEQRRKLYPIVAQSPALITNYGGNVVPAMIGRDVFRDYYLPHYNEAADIFHKHGKLLGCHFDDKCALIADLIGQTRLDYIEAFTPAPDTDMTLAQARKAWPGKILWINFPSSQHLKSDAEVKQITLDLLDQLDDLSGLIFGITEDVPEHRWRQSCTAIMDGLEEHALRHPQRYR